MAPTTVPAKDRPAGVALTIGPGATPVPERVTVLVLPPATTVRVPVRLPAAVGLNVTPTVQDPLAGMDVPQLLVCAKSPVEAMDETAAAEPLGLVTVTVWAALVAPVATEPKLSAPGEADGPSGMYGGKVATAAAGSPQTGVPLMPELPPPSVRTKLVPSQLKDRR